MQYNVVLVGAGQLGSRHLQGLKTAVSDLFVYVVEPSEDSLRIAKERYEQVGRMNFKEVFFVKDFSAVPTDIDIAIIATSSKPRFAVTRQLIEKKRVKNIVFEKFLFPSLEEYDSMEEQLNQRGITAYVNCPRRMFPVYQELRKRIDPSSPVEMQYVNTDWGMCCNSIHFIDLFMYLTRQSDYTLDLSGVEEKLYASKREGYIEFMGEEKMMSLPHSLRLSCYPVSDAPTVALLKIRNKRNSFVIDETNKVIDINGEQTSFDFFYQSQLTGKMVDEILMNGTCGLADFHSSALFHKVYLSGILQFYNKLTGRQNQSCPIT